MKLWKTLQYLILTFKKSSFSLRQGASSQIILNSINRINCLGFGGDSVK